MLVFENLNALRELGIYEEALLWAYSGCRVNTSRWGTGTLAFMFRRADKSKLRMAGDPLPESETFTLYRGVAGYGRARRIKGYSWTSCIRTAQWFAERSGEFGVPDPAVYEVSVPSGCVLAYTNGRDEQEFIVELPRGAKPTRVTDQRLLSKEALDQWNKERRNNSMPVKFKELALTAK